MLQIVVAQFSTIIHILGLFALVHVQNHRCVLGLENDRLCLDSLSQSEQ